MILQIERALAIVLGAGLLAACQPKEPPSVSSAPPVQPVQSAPISEPRPSAVIAVNPAVIPARPTRVLDANAAQRLVNNSGLTLQWISWDKRGKLDVTTTDGEYWIEGRQETQDGLGMVYLNGRVTEIGSDYFLFDGEVSIVGAPNKERVCKRVKAWRFAVTQNRKYYRLREFEWCDRLTDYIDIYF